jgi:plasmid stabilization system protein ParE
MTELFWTPEAIHDREVIYDYIEADNPVAALALDELFEEKAGRLVDHSGMGQLGIEFLRLRSANVISDAWR